MHAYQIREGKKVSLINFNPNDTKLWKLDKKDAKKAMKDLREDLIDLQQLLYAEQKHKVLIVLQAREELDHDYLWRIHKQTPKSGEIVIFNRSHYEDVLVVRVHQLVSEDIWRKRYEHIRNFEKTLTDEGTTILKFFLHISKEEQKERFIERIEINKKQWKFNPKDIDERKLWDDYMRAYEDSLIKTSTASAPWYVIPANRNWYRDYVIIKIITEALKKLKMTFPKPVENIKQYKSLLK